MTRHRCPSWIHQRHVITGGEMKASRRHNQAINCRYINLQTPLNFVFDATQTCNTVIQAYTYLRGVNFRLYFRPFWISILLLCFNFLFRTLSVLCSAVCLSMVSIFLFRTTCFFLFNRKISSSLFVYVSIRALPYHFQFHIFVSPPIGHSRKLKQKENA